MMLRKHNLLIMAESNCLEYLQAILAT